MILQILSALGVFGVVIGCTPSYIGPNAGDDAPEPELRLGAQARAFVDGCEVFPSPPEKYNRVKQFGRWIDADHDGLDTRQEIFEEESLAPATRKGRKIIAGAWLGPYTNRRILSPSKLQGEHLVSLREAWDWGAWEWSKEKRVEFANYLGDKDHLLAVYGPENQSKGARGIADSDRGSAYLPPVSKCEFAIARTRVWANPHWGFKYVPVEEKDATALAIATYCPPQYSTLRLAE